MMPQAQWVSAQGTKRFGFRSNSCFALWEADNLAHLSWPALRGHGVVGKP